MVKTETFITFFMSCFISAIGLESCPEPQTPNYGIRQGDRFMVGDVVQFSCEQGYSLQVKLIRVWFLCVDSYKLTEGVDVIRE